MTPQDRFEAIYDAYYPAIHQYAARRTGSADDTADVISETFLTAFDALPERDREVLALACWEGLTSEQIAKVVECTAIAARTRLHRARKRLAARLERPELSTISVGEA
ncbi:RNA polymerase sigma factor [Nonomuraea sp. NPDC050783]|uniref:RNA polymerase sigma factor n=1 Tax=Nonomuraea sp. NPDC050783 TaxID=3154634 RepID=UPI0034668DB2